MNIQQYARSLATLISSIFQREKIAAGLLEINQGPLTLTYRIGLMDPTRQQIKAINDMGDILQAKLLVESARVQMAGGIVEIQIPVPEQFINTPTADDMRAGSEGLEVCIGWNQYGEPATVDLTQHGAMFWVGPSRRGKTQSMRSTLYSIAKNVGPVLRYAIICQPAPAKYKDWEIFDKSKHSMGILTDTAEIEQAMRYFAELTGRGIGLFKWIVLIDDLPSILARCDIETELSILASVGAGVGIHLLAGTQTAGSKQGSGGEIIESNITARVLYKPASKATAARNAGEGGLDLDQLSTIKGDAILRVDGHNERIATSLALDEEIATLPQGRIDKMHHPWAKRGAAKAVTAAVTAVTDQAVMEPVTAAVTATDQASLQVYETKNEDVTTRNRLQVVTDGKLSAFTLPTDRQPSEMENAIIFATYKKLGSKNQTMRQVWGGKNGRYQGWLDNAIAQFETVSVNEEGDE